MMSKILFFGVFVFFIAEIQGIPSNEYKELRVRFNEKKQTIILQGKVYKLKELTVSVNGEVIEKELEESMNDFAERDYDELVAEGVAQESREAYKHPAGSGEFWFCVGFAGFLTLFAGMMSGLTVGYLSIDELVLELKSQNGTEEEKRCASIILPILKNHHVLLITLLIANAMALEALPIFLDSIVPSYMAILISVVLVLFFGEIIPQAVCIGPKQIQIAAGIAPLVKTLIVIFGILAYPLAKLLDWLLGEHARCRFHNQDLKALVELHSFRALERMEDFNIIDDMGLRPEQTNLIMGALDLFKIKASQAMIPYKNVKVINIDDILTHKMLTTLLRSGYSRFPVYKGHNINNIIGIFHIKRLIGAQFGNDFTFGDLNLPIRQPLIISPEMSLNDLLIEFQKGKSHIAVVTSNPGLMMKRMGIMTESQITYLDIESEHFNEDENIPEVFGIVTLEDVLEEILKGEIFDEEDYDKHHNAYQHPYIPHHHHHNHGHLIPPPLSPSTKMIRSKELAEQIITSQGDELTRLVEKGYDEDKAYERREKSRKLDQMREMKRRESGFARLRVGLMQNTDPQRSQTFIRIFEGEAGGEKSRAPKTSKSVLDLAKLE